ncbi:hypothetical protein [Mycolicibacterium arenosum]|uniref:Uncharacterized protein n=1 Tax=Mycolicibacterium arenosum TaxID=2952157 RepID=A0ABT1MDE0_9MYCO|nr:hypothetical protein [Mycolicibacterium sp. CAU 1645]MCP9276907.1 hypothetical protein [Mycolicibacterium sp. CAU 1645]
MIDQLASGGAPWGFGPAGTEPVDAAVARQIAAEATRRLAEVGLEGFG